MLRKSLVVAAMLLAILLMQSGQARAERKIGKIIGTVGGASAGFLAGFVLSDDDAIEAGRKMTRNVIIGAVAGGVGGYFLGRTVDRFAFNYQPNPVDDSRIIAELIEQQSRKLGATEPRP
ncbi:MAG: hypothetical protein ACR2L2_02705 [Acidobacteriota bacterium]